MYVVAQIQNRALLKVYIAILN